MSEDDCKAKKESVEDTNNKLDELDYEEELDMDSKYAQLPTKSRPEAAYGDSDDGAVSDSDGEVKSENNNHEEDDDDDDGEVKSPRGKVVEQQPSSPETEEDGEINDGEKVKKAFIPRVLCKYYQRGKCTWGRTCKFLHPGVNDTGNYSFLEFQDPNAKVYQQQFNAPEAVDKTADTTAETEAVQTESAWERGLRHAREMKEKAKQRKLAEKDQFDDKKMNLSLKEFENEKENDERYFNVVQATNVDDEEDEDLHLFAQSGRAVKTSNSDRAQQPTRASDVVGGSGGSRGYGEEARRHGTTDYIRPRQQANDYGRSGGARRESSPPFRANRGKADEWHDPWDRSRQGRKDAVSRRDRSKSYSSSGSDSRSRGRSESRSSYSSSSSKSYSSKSSDSSRSGSRSPKSRRKSGVQQRGDKKPNPKQLSNDLKKKIESLKNKTGSKPLPGRQISDISLKKAGLDTEKSNRKNKKTRSRSRSNSSMSSYDSSESMSDDKDVSENSDSYSDGADDKNSDKKKYLKQQQNSSKGGLKRLANDSKLATSSKKSRTGATGGDKKQMIKDQLKLIESALKKKSMAK